MHLQIINDLEKKIVPNPLAQQAVLLAPGLSSTVVGYVKPGIK